MTIVKIRSTAESEVDQIPADADPLKKEGETPRRLNPSVIAESNRWPNIPVRVLLITVML